jgi:hypothetical protein
MSFTILFLLFIVVSVYWLMTQILPERRRNALVRPTLGLGVLDNVNSRRHQEGLALLEVDEALMSVAKNKAAHQVESGRDEDGWEYPPNYADMIGQSLLMEILLKGPVGSVTDRICRQRDLFEDEWVSCGIGVAGTPSGDVVVAMVLSREVWEPATDAIQYGLSQELVLGE